MGCLAQTVKDSAGGMKHLSSKRNFLILMLQRSGDCDDHNIWFMSFWHKSDHSVMLCAKAFAFIPLDKHGTYMSFTLLLAWDTLVQALERHLICNNQWSQPPGVHQQPCKEPKTTTSAAIMRAKMFPWWRSEERQDLFHPTGGEKACKNISRKKQWSEAKPLITNNSLHVAADGQQQKTEPES